MADATRFRDTVFGGNAPVQSTMAMRANTLVVGNTIACRDSDGNAAGPGSDSAVPRNAVGVFQADFDNRTTAPAGGAAGAINAEIRHGVHFFAAEAGHAPVPDQVCYVVDNQTISTDSSSSTRGIAGYCVAVKVINGLTQYGIFMSPAVAGQIVIAATEAAQLDQAQADIDAAEAAIANLQTDAAVGFLPIPLDALRFADGTKPAAFADGSADGFAVSEGPMFRWNVSSTTVLWASVPMPADLDDASDVVLHALVSREGSADATAALTVGAFFQTVGAAYTGDTDAGGDTDAADGATTVVTEVTRTIDADDVPAAPCSLSISFVPTSALDADDLNLHALWLEYTRTLTA